MQFHNADLITIDPVIRPSFSHRNITAFTLRLDKCHPVVSGNKWFKLQFYLEEAKKGNKKTIATFGGPWSNHLVATAAACNSLGLQSIGYVRGEKPKQLSPTLLAATSYGMNLQFLSRACYAAEKNNPTNPLTNYVIAEGGFGELGVKGAATIANLFNEKDFTHVLAAVGSGTMIAGLAQALHQVSLIGIPALKGKEALEKAIKKIAPHAAERCTMLEGFEWGGFAKHPAELLSYMNQLFKTTHIPTDIVYTAKLFYVAEQLAANNYFKENSRLLLIHSGGLQGNQSLKKEDLCFPLAGL
ncbi:MAG: pyridoxal-phosphate dependent enzyme [Bacteroidetes bacterium]|nr:pyridoxal-phosphate dependent enzyme [Bacteroidota bacterium]